MNDTKSAAAHHPNPTPIWPHGRPQEPTPRRASLVWNIGATIVAMIIGMVIGVAWTTAGPAGKPTPQPLSPICRMALDSAATISGHARYDWDEAQTWINVGAMSQYADQRAAADAMLRKTDAEISAREDLLERAQTEFTTALKGCTA